jgi:hypothetical protein
VVQLQSDLDGGYQVKDSPQFILLSALDEESSRNNLVFAGRTLDQIQERLKDPAWKSGCGNHLILRFAEEDDYHQYVSYFHRQGNHPTSGGCLSSAGGHVHIAAPYRPQWFRPMLSTK